MSHGIALADPFYGVVMSAKRFPALACVVSVKKCSRRCRTFGAVAPVSVLCHAMGAYEFFPGRCEQGVRSQIEDVRAGMLENVDKVLERGEKIEVSHPTKRHADSNVSFGC